MAEISLNVNVQTCVSGELSSWSNNRLRVNDLSLSKLWCIFGDLYLHFIVVVHTVYVASPSGLKCFNDYGFISQRRSLDAIALYL